MPHQDERALIERCLAGESEAWDELFEEHCGAIRAVAAWKKWGFDPHEIEDVSQSVMEAVIKSLKTFEFKSRVSTFVYKIAVSTCVGYLRRKTARKRGAGFMHVPLDPIETDSCHSLTGEVSSGLKNQEQLLLDREMVQSVRAALGKLGKPCRDLIRSRYFMDISFREISERTGVKENTLVVQMKRCLIRLSNYLQAEV